MVGAGEISTVDALGLSPRVAEALAGGAVNPANGFETAGALGAAAPVNPVKLANGFEPAVELCSLDGLMAVKFKENIIQIY